MHNPTKRSNENGANSFLWRYIFIPEMIPSAAFVITMLTAWRRGVISSESIQAQPHLWGSVGAAFVTASSTALFSRWRENRDEGRSKAFENTKRLLENIEQCIAKSGEAIESGQFYIAETKLMEAKKLFEEIYQDKTDITLQKQYVALCYKIAYVMYHQKKYSNACNILDTLVLSKFKNHRDGLNLKGIILFKLCDNENALKCFESSLTEDNNQNSIYLVRSLLKGNYNTVINHNPFENISGDEPLSSDSFLQQNDIMEIEGLAYLNSQKHTEALNIFLAALTTLPSKILYLIDKSYYYIKICEAAILLRAAKLKYLSHNWYTDSEISTLLELKIKSLGGYIPGCHFLLSGTSDGKYPGEDTYQYYVTVTSAIDTFGLALPIDYFLDKIKQHRNPFAEMLSLTLPAIRELEAALGTPAFKERLKELIGNRISPNDREDTLNKVAAELNGLGFSQERIQSKIQELDQGGDKRDVFDEIKDIISNAGESHIKILFPYNITQLHWLTAEIKIHKRDRQYKVELTAHDPYGAGEISKDNYQRLCVTITKQIKNIDKIAVIEFENVKSAYSPRQEKGDEKSCGVIVVEDLTKRITGVGLQQPRSYLNAAEEIRQQHIAYVKSLPEIDISRRRFLERHSSIDVSSPANKHSQGADIQIETLDKKNLNITQEYINKSLEKAKDLLNEYKDFDSKNPRIEKLQLLIDEIDNKINPRQERRPS